MPPIMNMYMNPVRRMVYAPAALQKIPPKRDFSFDVGGYLHYVLGIIPR